MNVLVTGCAGFIGARVAELLLQDDHTVFGIDDLNDSYDPRIKSYRLARLNRLAGFTFARLDVADSDLLGAIAAGTKFDAIFNLAARAGVRQSVEAPKAFIQTNLTGTLNLLEFSRIRGIPRFIQASTSSVYGDATPPFQEDVTGRPLSPYAVSKMAAEQLCHTYSYLHGVNTVALRYFTVYGPAGRPDMSIFRFIRWIYENKTVRVFGDGHQQRDYTFVNDIARGTVNALGLSRFAVVNLGSESPVSILDVIGIISRLAHKRPRIEFAAAHPADVRSTRANTTLAQRLLGWHPTTSIENGIEDAFRWYVDNRDMARELLPE